jgi:hypothetical protein
MKLLVALCLVLVAVVAADSLPEEASIITFDDMSVDSAASDPLEAEAASFVTLSTKAELALNAQRRRVYWRSQVLNYVKAAGLPVNLIAEQEQAEQKQGGSGYKEMDPVMTKIDELEKKTRAVQAEAEKSLEAHKTTCAANDKRIGEDIANLKASIEKKTDAIKTIRDGVAEIEKKFDVSKAATEKIDKEITSIFSSRKLLDDAYEKRKTARLAEIQTMRKANALVCTFDKFKDTDFCKEVRNNAVDIADPKANDGESLDEIIAKSKAMEADFAKKWEEEKKANAEAAKKGLTKPAPYQVPDLPKSDETLAEKRSRLASSVESLLHSGNSSNSSLKLLLQKCVALVSEGGAESAEATLPKLMKEMIQRLVKEQKRETIDYMESLRAFHGRFTEASSSIRFESDRRHSYNRQILSLNRKTDYTVRSIDLTKRELRNQEDAKAEEKRRCDIYIVAHNAATQGRDAAIRNMDKLRSMLRVLRTSSLPKCEGDCTSTTAGKCIWKGLMGQDSFCACNKGYYGKSCEKKMCTGSVEGRLYLDTDLDACSTKSRGACQADGTCKCNDTFYGEGCQYKKCPGNDNCNLRGSCIRTTGTCSCQRGFSGADCSDLQCRMTHATSEFANWDSPLVCNNHGDCSKSTGKCTCKSGYEGTFCENKKCPNDCNSRGTCDGRTGRCRCNYGYDGSSCENKTCKNNCGGFQNGICNGRLGVCYCHSHASGVGCGTAQQCSQSANRATANWWSSFDKVGWSLCPSGMLLTGLWKNTCNALYCIEEAQCRAPCEGGDKIALGSCYNHNWWSSFDRRGWSSCSPNYYLAGFMRNSCNSLYCLEEARCCGIVKAVWNSCGNANWTSFGARSRSWSDVQSSRRFMTGIYRNDTQDLSGIEYVSACSFRRSSNPSAY